MKKNGNLNEKQAIIFLKQIVNAFKILHENNIIYRDFKIGYILLHEGQVKIADSGLSI